MPEDLIDDTLQSFVYLRVTVGATPNLQQALADATVDLYELDNPAPAGDDVVLPATGESEKITQKLDITEVREYQPSADKLIGTGTTDENGLVTFIALTYSSGGILRDTKTTRDVHTDQLISTHTVTRVVPETKPDYGVTITTSDGAVIAQRMLIALNAPGNQLGSVDNPFTVPILTSVVTLPTDPSVLVATPVMNARAWASGLAPNSAGSWNYITEIYELHDPNPPEWVVVDVHSGVTRRFNGVPGVYANDQMHIGNQLRAANGRIFFPCAKNHIAYYEPADEKIHEIPQIIPPNTRIDNIIYRAVFGPDGKIYGATQSAHLDLPMVFQLDPDTLTIRVLGNVGRDRLSYSYGYDVRVDPPWVYVAVGEQPWELAALNIDTGAMTILKKLEGLAPWMHLSDDENAVIATLTTDQGLPTQMQKKCYLADGQAFPYPYTGQFVPRVVTPFSNKIVNPVEIDDSDGAGLLSWRPYESQGAWTKIHYSVNNRVPIPIESLAPLPDGTLIGNSSQYNGFWRYNPTADSRDRTTWYGVRSGLDVSQPLLEVSDGLLYITGYPNGVLFSYDWSKPWGWVNPQDHTDHTPKKLGDFHSKSKMKYARCLISGSNGRLYCAGHRERDGQGTGLGSYHRTKHQFAGQFSNPPNVLNFLEPSGLVEIGGQIVFSGKVIRSLTTAQLVTYGYDLEPISQAIVELGALDTGQLFKISDTVLMGVVNSTPVMTPPGAPGGPGWVYLFNVSTAALLLRRDLDAQLGAATQRADGSVWLMCGRAITRVDPATLATRTIGTLSAPASHMAWLGDDLYLSIGPELRVVSAVPQ
jgi:hypothetical protein